MSSARQSKGGVKPDLPTSFKNPLVQDVDLDSTQVKFQVITRGDTEEIVVGRLKIPTPGEGHAFVLRRFDTGAVSVSTMLRAAYHQLPDELEKKETNRVRSAHDIAGANGAGPRRLAGIWAPIDVAAELAKEYGISHVIGPLTNASPTDDDKIPRRSTRSSTAGENGFGSAPPTPQSVSGARSPSKAKSPPPSKKRRAGTPSSPAPSDGKKTRTSARVSASPSVHGTRQSMSPGRTNGSRRSAIKSPKLKPSAVIEADGEDVPPVDELAPNAAEDIAEQQALVATLKAAKAAAEEDGSHTVTSVSVKRLHEDEAQLTLNIVKEGDADALALTRPIATNRRIELTPTRKAAAWGALAFGLGLSAVAFLPNLLG